MKRLTPSGEELSIQFIWDWYEYHLTLSLLSKVGLVSKIMSSDPDVDPRFFAMSLDEIEDFFAELGRMAMLDLLAATEAVIRLDYWTRVDDYKKDDLSRKLRALYKEKQLRVSLEDDLLETWRELRPATKPPISDFKGVLKLRHWLAHGRYWEESFARDYSPGDVFDICSAIIQAVETS